MWDVDKCFHFHILGLLLHHLHRPAFGKKGSDQERRIYNRFFRSTVAYVLRGFFGGYGRVTVRVVFHDKTEMERDPYFDWHTIWKLESEYSEMDFSTSRIEFIDSDHRREKRYPDHSHFIQLTDLILGATKQCLDFTSRSKQLMEVGKHFLPLVQRLTDSRHRSNPNSRYLHFQRCSISFFPRRRLRAKELADPLKRELSGFFHQRRLLLLDHVSGQGELFH